MARWGAKISQEEKDVKTCADKDLVFSSDWNTYRIKQIVRRRITSGIKDVYYHNLGYVPFVWGYLEKGDGIWVPDQTYEDWLLYEYPIDFSISVGNQTIESNFNIFKLQGQVSLTKNIVLIIMENL